MIETLIELQRLKRLDRTGWTLRGLAPGAESVGAHTYGVAVVAMFISDQFRAANIDVDVERVLRMALLHDAAEVRMGDLPRTATAYFGSDLRTAAETRAINDIFAPLQKEIARIYKSLHEEYERRESIESRIVKAADLIDLLLQALLFERAGVRGLDEFWEGVFGREMGFEGRAKELIAGLLEQIGAERGKYLRGGA